MKSRPLLLALCLAILLAGCAVKEPKQGDPAFPPPVENELRGVWMSYSEIGSLCRQGADRFYRDLCDSFQALASKGINAVFFHARAFADAFYDSSLFPWSSYLTGEQGVDPGFDPLALALQAAHGCGLQLHAWINPYRVSYDPDITKLCASNPARRMYESGNGENLLITESGVFFDPSSLEAQRLILDGARELLENYELDGLHIDDYFYPADISDADGNAYQAYTRGGGTLALDDWPRTNVSALVGGLYSLVKSVRPQAAFGVSPGGDPEKDHDTDYADVERWASSSGYCDYIIPQLYFGFSNKYSAFEPLLERWANMDRDPSVKLYVGLALYKSGLEDDYAGEPDSRREWLENRDIISRQIRAIRSLRCDGFCLFSFRDLTDPGDNTVKAAEVSAVFDLLTERELPTNG